VARYRVSVEVGDRSFSDALTAYLNAQPEFITTADRPDVVVLDVDGADISETIAARSRRLGVLARGEDDPARMIGALEAGALGYILTSASFDQIAEGLRRVGNGDGVVPPAMLGDLLRHMVVRRRVAEADRALLKTLTGREREVLELVAAGLDRAAIGEHLYIATDTVRTHLMRVFRKLNVHTQAEAAAFAARCGLAPHVKEEND
jgi:DNA-binding NarL/FixJ family response regulator